MTADDMRNMSDEELANAGAQQISEEDWARIVDLQIRALGQTAFPECLREERKGGMFGNLLAAPFGPF